MMGLAVLAMVTVLYTMVAKRLASTSLTAPIVFIVLGVLLAEGNMIPLEMGEESLHLVAELALIILLFLDAAQVDLSVLRRKHVWPVRMLLIGLPLSILIGAALAFPFLSGWPFIVVLLVAAILSPTDAALGQAVVGNPDVPARSRRALTVESGLNDGLALPIILLLASMAATMVDTAETNWLLFGAKQLILGPIVGIVMGFVGAHILLKAKHFQTTSETFEGIGALAMACGTYLMATLVDGNGFVAAFIAGLVFGNIVKGQCKFIFEFTEGEGQMLAWGAFFLLGLTLVPEAIEHLTLSTLGLILVSLFVVRPLAIWISLIGTDASAKTRLFFGWFGPRGLATALFALIVVPQIEHTYAEPLLYIAINAVWISALLHGISAAPASRWYARMIEKDKSCGASEPIEASAKPLKNCKS